MKPVKAIQVFSALTDGEREVLSAKNVVRSYRKGEIIVRQNETMPSLMMATLRALTDVIVFEVDQASFAPLLLERPELAEDLAAILSAQMPTIGEDRELLHQRQHSKFALLGSTRKAFRLARTDARHHL